MRWNFLFTSTERVLAFSMLALMFLAWIEFFGYTLITTEMPSRSPASRKRTTCLTVMLRGLGVQDIGMRLLILALKDIVILGLNNWLAGFPFKRKSPLTGLFFRLFFSEEMTSLLSEWHLQDTPIPSFILLGVVLYFETMGKQWKGSENFITRNSWWRVEVVKWKARMKKMKNVTWIWMKWWIRWINSEYGWLWC